MGREHALTGSGAACDVLRAQEGRRIPPALTVVAVVLESSHGELNGAHAHRLGLAGGRARHEVGDRRRRLLLERGVGLVLPHAAEHLVERLGALRLSLRVRPEFEGGLRGLADGRLRATTRSSAAHALPAPCCWGRR